MSAPDTHLAQDIAEAGAEAPAGEMIVATDRTQPARSAASERPSRPAPADAPATRRPPTKLPPTVLALGGGGSRGVAHLGVIEVLLKSDWPIERIVGVSIGSLAGAMYAFNPNIEEVEQQALDYLLSPAFQRHQETLFGARPSGEDETSGGLFAWYDRVKRYLHANRLFHRIVQSSSMLPGVILNDVVEFLLPDADIADAKVPLTIVTVDLHSGQKIVLEKGPVRDAVRGSSALPGIFPPVELDGMLLSDVGVFYSLPIAEAKSYHPHHVTAVDVSSGLRPLAHCDTALDVMMRMDEIGEAMFRRHVIEAADLVVRPHVSGIEWFDFSPSERLIEAGRQAARRAVAEWRQAVDHWQVQTPLFRRVGRWLGRLT